jgi:hypothetical protein
MDDETNRFFVHVEDKNTYLPEGKRPFGCRDVDYKIILKHILTKFLEDVDLVYLALDGDRWRALVVKE